MARHMNLRRVVAFGMGVLFIDIIFFGWFASVDFGDIEPTLGIRFLGFIVLIISWPAMLLEFVLPKSMVELAVGIGLVLTILFWGVVIEILYKKIVIGRPKQSPEPTAVGASRSAGAVHGRWPSAKTRRRLSFFR